MHRLFTAIIPPPTVRNQLSGLMGGVEQARWQRDDQLHVTLRYIGEVDTRLAEDIANALLALQAPPFDIRMAGVGGFDRKGRVDQIWAGVKPVEAITGLHHKIDQALVRIGLPPEARTYKPHCTLARFSHGGDVSAFLVQNNDLRSNMFCVASFGLLESKLGKGGAHYEQVAQYPLTAKTG